MKSQLKQILCIPKIVSSEKLLKQRVQTTQYQDNWDTIYVRETSNRITCLIYCRHYKKTVKVYEEVEYSLVCLSSKVLYGLCHTWSVLMQVIGFLYLFRICDLENFFYVFSSEGEKDCYIFCQVEFLNILYEVSIMKAVQL